MVERQTSPTGGTSRAVSCDRSWMPCGFPLPEQMALHRHLLR